MTLPSRPSAASLAVAVVLAGCGGKSQLVDGDPFGGGSSGAEQDAGPDAEPIGDASADVAVDQAADATADAGDDAGPARPGLGAACDGKKGNPKGCAEGLSCFTGGGDPSQSGRWPGGYCTTQCGSDADCADYGGVCSGAQFGQGQCYVACTQPTDCRQGYACRGIGFGAEVDGCAPTGFVATRGAGVACFQSTAPGAAHYLARPARTHFGPSQLVDTQYFSTDEVALAVDGANHVVLGANALSQQGNTNPAFYGTGTPGAIKFANDLGPRGGNAAYYSDPYLVVGQDGTFYYSTLGLDGQASTAWLYVGRSTDLGATWETVQANPQSDCASTLGGQGPCMDHPWLAIGPDKANPGGEALYAAYLATQANDYPTVLIKSADGGKTWGTPGHPGQSLAVFSPNDLGLFVNLITPSVDEDGVVHIVAAGIASNEKGSTANAIYYTRSDDGGASVVPSVRVNASSQPVPFEQPVVAAGNGRVHIAYVVGGPDGAWDVWLATSSDGKTWTRTKLNDEPEGCATHFHPAIAIDRAADRVYVAWYDGRYAPYDGLVALTSCAGDPAAPSRCTANEAVSDTPFFITTDRTNLLFLGDYFTLVARPNGQVWAGFGSTQEESRSHAFVSLGSF